MEKPKKWQRILIIAVLLLTVFNILPTVFFYAKSLKAPIDAKRSEQVAGSIAERVDALEQDSVSWIQSFCKLLKVKTESVQLNASDPQLITVQFKNAQDAARFQQFLPRAGNLIAFVPSQLSLYDFPNDRTVVVQRRIPVHLDDSKLDQIFQFSFKRDENGQVTNLYRALINDRALELGVAIGGVPENAALVQAIVEQPTTSAEFLQLLSQNILSFTQVFPQDSVAAQRFFASFTQFESPNNKADIVQKLLSVYRTTRQETNNEIAALEQESRALAAQNGYLEVVKQQKLEQLKHRDHVIGSAEAIVQKYQAAFGMGGAPLNYAVLGAAIQKNIDQKMSQAISLDGRNPFIQQIVIDWAREKITLSLYPDLVTFKQTLTDNYRKDLFDQLLYNDIASASRQAGEVITPAADQFEIALNDLDDSKSFLALRLSNVAKAELANLKQMLASQWHPQHPDLARGNFPILDYESYLALPAAQRKLALVVYSPAVLGKMPPKGFRMNSIYVVAKGVDKILQRLEKAPDSEQTKQFLNDFKELREILQKRRFVGYSGSAYAMSPEFAGDFIFEEEDYYQDLLKASRENFTVHGTKRFAILEFSNVEQRILAENRIDDSLHEDLLKWRDDFRAAQLNMRGTTMYDVPKPTKNVLWDNFKLSFIKYFRGDDRKIIHWGLDLSGGKTVQIELRDHLNRQVTNEADINQGINELYTRVNKMGVSEVKIRQEGNTITLDFPGSQAISAAELVKASSMFFHVVNEKFGPGNSQLADASNRFLQEVWNEAVVTGKKDIEQINTIAWRHLYGDSSDLANPQPRSESARILFENGLRLASPMDTLKSSSFNETYSQIAIWRGNDYTDWEGQTNPLLIVFRNYALEGSDLETVQASYDPSKGNYLSFTVKGSHTTSEGQKINPRDDVEAWTTPFSKEKIAGTPEEAYSHGKGWRMAVILNGSIISAPTLDSHLRDSAMITGSFTQREVNQLEADLKAGSLTFTPRILSEKNVSPELGARERVFGVAAMIISLALVIALMISYYRFSGFVASIAVLLNLLILWATLQNIQATLTLATIAGVVLTLGMAVDANVLVFERIREEFAISGRIASAVHNGYRKAFSAIVDSNLTTVIAAFILLHFDSGPIKGFAVTLIIGIISSMFTALFLTRYFFSRWVQNPQHKELKMANLIKGANFNFIKYAKPAFYITCAVIVIGGALLFVNRSSIVGMDFKGGYALNVELKPSAADDYRRLVEKALVDAGASAQDFQIRELSPANNVRVFLSRGMEQSGKPFYGMPIENDTKGLGFSYEANPKIVWIVQALAKQNLQPTADSLKNLDKNWTEVGGQISDAMRNNAAIGLILAFICILVYITFRFEFKYAISATICTIHDVVFTLAAMGILQALGVPLQIDLNTVAALMTITGYSLNDTIIVFDRVREDIRLMRRHTFTEILNHALNVTLSRTLMTSGTTLIALVPLVLLGGSTIFGFALVMVIGVIFGTLSSLFIAAPLLKYFNDREAKQADKPLIQG